MRLARLDTRHVSARALRMMARPYYCCRRGFIIQAHAATRTRDPVMQREAASRRQQTMFEKWHKMH
jgi:hypothetical protein